MLKLYKEDFNYLLNNIISTLCVCIPKPTLKL